VRSICMQKRKVLSLEWTSEGVVDDESGESMEQTEEVPLIRLGETELEILVRGWRREAGSWFPRRGEAYWKERSVICREADDNDVSWRFQTTKKALVVLAVWQQSIPATFSPVETVYCTFPLTTTSMRLKKASIGLSGVPRTSFGGRGIIADHITW